jgi:hypothetical protein
VNGAWTAPATVPVTGDGWFGIEDARDAVREQLIGF